MQGNTFHIYGGTFEKADRKFTFNNLYIYYQLWRYGWMVLKNKEDEEGG